MSAYKTQRDVLIPLAAETRALILGSAFQDAGMMMMFARVAMSVDSKYGGCGASPWTMLGFAAAPQLLQVALPASPPSCPATPACAHYARERYATHRRQTQLVHTHARIQTHTISLSHTHNAHTHTHTHTHTVFRRS